MAEGETSVELMDALRSGNIFLPELLLFREPLPHIYGRVTPSWERSLQISSQSLTAGRALNQQHAFI